MAASTAAPSAAGSVGAAPAGAVTVITQTRVKEGQDAAFAAWQQRIGDAAAKAPGQIDHAVFPPSPPGQVDWVIVQRFASDAQALAWLHSDARLRLVEEIQPVLVGRDDVHLVRDGGDGAPATTVSAVIASRVDPAQEQAYQRWQARIMAAEARFPGFLGHKVERPTPGVQDDWVTILRFDAEPRLQAWLQSPERAALLAEAAPFTSGVHARVVRTGFDQWFPVDRTADSPPVWKLNMLTLLALYPVVFLFGHFVATPVLQGTLGLPFWLSLFLSNVAGVLILNYLVPWISGQFGWWLRPADLEPRRATVAGAVIVVALYALFLLAFALLP